MVRSFSFDSTDSSDVLAMLPDNSGQSRLFLKRSDAIPERKRPRATSLPGVEDHHETTTLPLHLSDDELLRRNLEMKKKLVHQNMELERCSLKKMQLEIQMYALREGAEKDHEKICRLETRLQLTRERFGMMMEYRERLCERLNESKDKIQRLTGRIDALTGESDLTQDTFCISELEDMEKDLENGLQQVRQALRQKYRRAGPLTDRLCVICAHNPISTILLPCKHQILCSMCSDRVDKCPIDRSVIADKIQPFTS